MLAHSLFFFIRQVKQKGDFAKYDTQSNEGNSKIGERKIQ